MSIVIQKKRFNNKNSQVYAKAISAHERHDFHYQQYTKTFEEFENNFRKNFVQGNLKGLKQALDIFYKHLKTDELLITDLSKHEGAFNKGAMDVFLIQRASKIVDMLADYLVNKRTAILANKKTFDISDKATNESREVIVMIVKILKLFAMVNPSFAVNLSHWPEFTDTVLGLIPRDNKLYFKPVLTIIEALIASNSAVIKPSMYPLILEILSSMPTKYFARFSRIVALFVLENSEKTDFKDLPTEFTENKVVKIHSFLLSVPNLLDVYVLVLEHLNKIIECLTTTTFENIHKSISYLKESKLIKDSGLNLSFLKPLFEQCQLSESLMHEVFNPKFMIKFIVKKSNITEILFIISNLLAGKRKVDIQNQLNQLNFFKRVIDPLFDILFHSNLNQETADDMANGNDHNNPLTTTRIQLLRIIINFCDRDTFNTDNKDLLISEEEKKILNEQLIQRALYAHTNGQETAPRNKHELSAVIDQMSIAHNDMCGPFFTKEILSENAFENVPSKGLLNKIITLLRKFPANSSYQFWLSSCVESFLRGFNCSHQIFVAHSGLLHTLLNQVMSNQITKSNNIQITYDLIGEIIKFNKYNVIFLENLCKEFEWTQGLPKRVAQNVVDSNVFLRSMILSFERFNLSAERQVDPIMKRTMKNFNYTISLFHTLEKESTLEWFDLLVEAVDPAVINQDNICCVNTALIIAIFADQKGGLQAYLDSLVESGKLKQKTPKQLAESFCKVLNVWQKYYLSKTKDCFSLQHTTSIKFIHFQDIKQKIQTFLEKSASKMSQ